MMKRPFIFRGQEMYYDYEWSDPDTLSFYFGEGELVDNNGDDYFIDVEYMADIDAFVFESMYEHDHCIATEEHLSEPEKREIMKFIQELAQEDTQ